MSIYRKAALAAGITALAAGGFTASASAYTIAYQGGGTVPANSVVTGTLRGGTPSTTTGQLTSLPGGSVAATCGAGTFTAKVNAASTGLDVTGITLTSCLASGVALTVTTNASPTNAWQLSPTSLISPGIYAGSLLNPSAVSASVKCGPTKTMTYTPTGTITGFQAENVSGQSLIRGVAVGPLTGTGTCSLPTSAQLMAVIDTTSVTPPGGPTYTMPDTTHNLWVQ